MPDDKITTTSVYGMQET